MANVANPTFRLEERLARMVLHGTEYDTMKLEEEVGRWERDLFQFRVSTRRDPVTFRVWQLMEGLLDRIEMMQQAAAQSKEDPLTNETFDRYFTAALSAATPSVVMTPEQTAGYALGMAITALELRKKALNGHRTEGSVHDDQRRDEPGDPGEVRPPG